MKTLLSAAWVAPMSSPVVRDGGVVIEDDQLLAIGGSDALRKAHPDAALRDFDQAIILPGLINAHTHLELSSCIAGDPPSSFIDWIVSMPRRMGREPNQRADELFDKSTRLGIEQCLRFGVTCVGDISQQMHVTRPILRDSPLRSVSFGEVIGLGKRRERFEELLPMAIDPSMQNDRLRIGLTPHSPYTVEPDGLRRCVATARERKLPLAIHLAETPDEREFLRSHRGPMREMWEMIGFWEDFGETFDGSPVAFAKSIGLLDYPTLLAHVNYCDDADLELLSQSAASVVYCPRTHRYFGHPPHRWREMMERGVNVAVGTDSCASSPDLNVVDDLRLLHQIAPEVPVETLWKMATVNAARAIGMTGRMADWVAFDCSSAEPLKEILENASLPREIITPHSRPASPC